MEKGRIAEDITAKWYLLHLALIVFIVLTIISTIGVKKLNDEYNELYKQAEQKIEQDDIQIKEYIEEINQKDTYIEWLQDQLYLYQESEVNWYGRTI